MKAYLMEHINQMGTEFIQVHSKGSVWFYDFEDPTYVDDIAELCRNLRVDYKKINRGFEIVVYIREDKND